MGNNRKVCGQLLFICGQPSLRPLHVPGKIYKPLADNNFTS